MTRMPPALLAVLTLAVLLNYVDRGSLAIAAPVLQGELRLSNTQLGILLSAFFWIYAPAQILAGWAVHRFKVSVILSGGVLIWSLATALMGAADGFLAVLLLRLLLGLGESATFPSYQLILSRRASEGERGKANGIIGAGQGIGPMVGTLTGGLLLAQYGWRPMFVGMGLVTLLWLLPWWRVTRDQALDGGKFAASSSVSYRQILGRRAFWGSALAHFSANYGYYLVLSWMPTYLVKVGGYTVAQMAWISAAIFGVNAVAILLSGFAADRLIRGGGSVTRIRKGFLLAATFGTAVTIGASALAPANVTVWLLGVAAAFFGLYTSNGFAVLGTLAGPRGAGRWAGAQNVAGQLAGVVAPIVTGIIVDRTQTYELAFATTAVVTTVAALSWTVMIRQIAEVDWPSTVVATHSATSAGG